MSGYVPSMGSNGGYSRPLPGQCHHKLATSCLLSSTKHCCACEDQRTHSSVYPHYVDGIGMTQSGTRWQSYCPACKLFWSHRVQVSGTNPRNTRIPEYPSQNVFIMYWMSFFLGFNLQAGGTLLKGEEWKNVPIGTLPRTQEEINEGYNLSTFEAIISSTMEHPEEHAAHHHQLDEEGIEDVLDRLLDESEDEPTGYSSSNSRSNSPPGWPVPSPPPPPPSNPLWNAERSFINMTNQATRQQARARIAAQDMRQLEASMELKKLGLDHPSRPQAAVNNEKLVKLECAVCFDQKATVGLVPCGHIVMCEWCADTCLPVRPNSMVPIGKESEIRCPTCREKVRFRVKMFV